MTMLHRSARAGLVAVLMAFLFGSVSYAADVPTGDQLTQLLAPIALYPDTLLAQICAASTDPQQIIDANNWLKQNSSLQGTALTEAAQKQGFDPAFVSLVAFPAVLDSMAINVDDYAALGAAFQADQKSVMAAIQALRQQAYASGALDTNQYQKVSVEQQNGAQVVVVQPANPQVVYVPVYQPQQVFVAAPSQSDVVAASLLSFGAGIAIGALINNNQPYAWGAWGWGWGGGGMYYHRNVFVVHNYYRSPYPPYRPRPPIYNRPGYPGYGRPPPNWNQRPGYRPPPPGYRPPRPPGNGGGYRPPPYKPPANRPPPTKPPPNGGGGRPPGNGGGSRPPDNGGKPPGNGGTRPPGGGKPPDNGGTRPPGNGGGNRPPGSGGTTRPAPTPQTRPAPKNPYAGFPSGGNRQPTQRPSSPPKSTGARPSGFGGNSNGGAERAASNRGKASAGGGNRSGGKP
jgi:hypothetical protein